MQLKMANVATASFLALLLAINGCFSAKIVIIPMFGRSHFMVLAKLAEELSSRGHQVSILIGEDSGYAAGKPHVKMFDFPPDERDENQKLVRQMSSDTKGLSFLDALRGLMRLQQQYCDLLLGNQKMINEARDADVIIGEGLYPCSALVADKFDLPHVVVNMGPVCTPFTKVYGLDPSPSYVPQMMAGLSAKSMSFKDKMKNVAFYVGNILISEFLRLPTFKWVKDKYNIKPNKSIKETLGTADLILLATDFAMDIPQPLPPNAREVGFFLPSPAKPLPAELEEFMQSSGDDGVVLISFGSMVNALPDKVIDAMNDAFAQLPQKVLWKIKLSNSYKGQIAPNIKIVSWLPQNDILGHSKTKLFYTHSGTNGVAEAAYHGVPMICSPFFGDQSDNSLRVKDNGLGEIMPVRTATTDQMVEVMRKVLTEKSYKENAIRVSKVMKMRKRTPTQEAADLIEYVHAVGNMSHLKPRGLDLPFYELYMLDVLCVLAIVLAIVGVIFLWLIKLVIRICLGTAKKTKTA